MHLAAQEFIPMFQIGDVLPAYEPPGIVRTDADGQPIGGVRWHALLVFPQKERAAKAWLRLWSVESFFPVKVGHTRRRGRLEKIEQLELPGYLFARFPGEPRWHRLIGFDTERKLVRDVLRMSDGVTPGAIHEEDLTALKRMRDMDAAIDEAKRLRRLLKPGDKARLTSGPLYGQEDEIVSVKGRTATFDLRLFGMTAGEADIDMLEKEGGE